MARAATPDAHAAWESLHRATLLQMRLCDLGLRIEGTWVEGAVARLHGELKARRLRFRPHVWVSDEWLCPDQVPGFAVPFYLLHPRLIRLERAMMLQAEGATFKECMRLMRHEAGHAIQNAFALHRRRRWQELFGHASDPYPESYRPNPASKHYVVHLDGWYAQSHPAEDFAETFAVWLSPRSGWRTKYANWGARRKLEYVDELMASLAGKPVPNKTRARPYPLHRSNLTLQEHYQFKRDHYRPGFAGSYDGDLRRLFPAPKHQGEPAAGFLRRNRVELRDMVSRWAEEHRFTIDQVMKQMIGRCAELKLRTRAGTSTKRDVAIVLALHSMNYVYKVRDWHAV
jgi:hypothetical protein